MRLCIHARAFAGAAIFTASTLVAAYGLAAPNDYRFELVQAQPVGSGKTTVTVRLIHMPDNKPVAGAVLFESKTDMGPGGMAEMTGAVSPLPSDQPGIYRFQIENRHGRQMGAQPRRQSTRRSRHCARQARL
jgi:YtkA-like